MFFSIFVGHRNFLANDMKIFKITASFLLISGILVLMIWAAVKANDQNCTGISVVIYASGEPELITKSDVLTILKQNNVEWKGKKMKEIDLTAINKILARENYIKTVDKVHFSGSKLQIEITLYNILLVVDSKDSKKFLLDNHGTYLPYSPKVENGVIIANGFISNTFLKKETITPDHKELYELFIVASLIKADTHLATWFNKMCVNDNREIILYPSSGKLPVLFGTMQNAKKKLQALKLMYCNILPYMNADKYAQLDVRFQNRIIATKSKS
jgi:cell division protein FtsQ